MKLHTRILKLGASTGALAAASMLGYTSASAQTPANAPSVETVVVTGTSIRGVAPVGSNLITVGPQEITNTGAATLTQVLANVPSLSSMGGTGRGPENGNGGQGQSVYIHELGASAQNGTLVVVDGHRIAPSGGLNPIVDPNDIPAIMLERVEVLADGASSIYGSDAVAGVVNFITRSKFDGVEFKAQTGIAADTTSYMGGVLAGKSWDDGGVIVGASFTYDGQLSNSARPKTDPLVQTARAKAEGLSGPGTTNFGNFNCNPSTLGIGPNIYLSPQSATFVSNTPANQTCSQWAYGAILPRDIRENVMIKGSQKLNDRLTLDTDLVYSNRTSKAITSRGTLSNATAFSTGTGANPFYTNPPGVSATSQTIRYDFDQLLGPGAVTTSQDDFVQGSAKLSYNLDDNWVIDLSAVAGRANSTSGSQGTVNGANALLALNGTTQSSGSTTATSIPGYNVISLKQPLTTLTALDVWNPVSTNRTSAATLNSLLDNPNQGYSSWTIEQYRLVANGTLFTLPGGPLKVAVGAELLNTNSGEYSVTPGLAAGAAEDSTFRTYEFFRKDTSEFVEADIPLVGPDMNVPLVRKFELDLSVRHDQYSGKVGQTTNPKVAFNWDVIDGLRLRGNMSTSFVAPPIDLVGDKDGNFSFASVRSGTAAGNIPVSNYPLLPLMGIPGCTASSVTCNGATLNGITISRGDPNNKPQKGRGWAVGFDYAPDFLPGLTTAFTYWDTTLLGGITTPTFNITVNNPGLTSRVTFYPTCATAAQIQAAVASTPVASVLPACVQFISMGNNSNYIDFYAQGIDANFAYKFDTDFGRISIDDNLTLLTQFDEGFNYQAAPLPGQLFSVLNTTGLNTTFPNVAAQMRGHLGWASDDGLLADLYMNYTGAYRNVSGTAVVPIQLNAAGVWNGLGGDHVKANTTFDLHLGYTFNGGMFGEDEVSLTVRDLFNQYPPYYNSSSGYDSFVGNIIGRQFTLSLTSKL
jgi:iron complex outermembrane receptor protein